MTAVNSRVPSSVALGTCAAAIAMSLAGCGSDAKTSSSAGSSSVADVATSSVAESTIATAALSCPSVAPQTAGAPEWTLTGATGSVAVTGSTDTAAPVVKVDAPFSVTETQVHTLKPGDGPVVAPTATVSVCYQGVEWTRRVGVRQQLRTRRAR